MNREGSIFRFVSRLANAGAPGRLGETTLRMAKTAASAGLHSAESGRCGDE